LNSSRRADPWDQQGCGRQVCCLLSPTCGGPSIIGFSRYFSPRQGRSVTARHALCRGPRSWRFMGQEYEEKLRQFPETKYRDKPIGIIVAVAAATLEPVRRWRDGGVAQRGGRLHRGRTAGAVAVESAVRCHRPSVPFRFFDCVIMARAVLPELKGIIVIGMTRRQMVFRGWNKGRMKRLAKP
jgi:hypothetical protein